eukprot:scaffold141467_cov17-Prasinocladus_malaysianus.AAC.1
MPRMRQAERIKAFAPVCPHEAKLSLPQAHEATVQSLTMSGNYLICIRNYNPNTWDYTEHILTLKLLEDSIAFRRA